MNLLWDGDFFAPGLNPFWSYICYHVRVLEGRRGGADFWWSLRPLSSLLFVITHSSVFNLRRMTRHGVLVWIPGGSVCWQWVCRVIKGPGTRMLIGCSCRLIAVHGVIRGPATGMLIGSSRRLMGVHGVIRGSGTRMLICNKCVLTVCRLMGVHGVIRGLRTSMLICCSCVLTVVAD